MNDPIERYGRRMLALMVATLILWALGCVIASCEVEARCRKCMVAVCQ